MNAWPVIERELRVRARQRSTMTTRFVAALIAGFVSAGATLILQDKYVPAEVGQHVFHLLTHVLLVLCLLIGSAATSDTLSSEKRDGTLDLLFLSNLSRFDIVLGKLASASLNGFFGLLACMPALAISISLGGVTQAEFWRTRLALFKTVLIVMAAPWLWLLMPQVGWVLAILSPFYSMGIMGSAQAKLRSELSQALGREH